MNCYLPKIDANKFTFNNENDVYRSAREYLVSHQRNVITVEDYCKWYTLYFIDKNGCVYDYLAYDKNALENIEIANHSFKPRSVLLYAKKVGLHIDFISFLAICMMYNEESDLFISNEIYKKSMYFTDIDLSEILVLNLNSVCLYFNLSYRSYMTGDIYHRKPVKTIIVSAFPGCTKPYITKYENDMNFISIDLNLNQFIWIYDENGNQTIPDVNFLSNYIMHIQQCIGLFDVIFVSSDEDVRNELIKQHIPFVLVYPDLSMKEEFLKRYEQRENYKYYIHSLESKYDDWVSVLDKFAQSDEFTIETGNQRIILNRDKPFLTRNDLVDILDVDNQLCSLTDFVYYYDEPD